MRVSMFPNYISHDNDIQGVRVNNACRNFNVCTFIYSSFDRSILVLFFAIHIISRRTDIQLSSYWRISSIFKAMLAYSAPRARSMFLRAFIPWNMRTMYVNKSLQDVATFLQD